MWHIACLNLEGVAGVIPMKTICRSNVTSHRKSKKQKKAAKTHSSTSIAERYMELRRLRERISEVESRLYAR